ncbi:MAG: TraR/DksA family transcriptional regulator [Phycisphaerales bacterium]|nr:TraR/DksA family transcriptional regulator [Phycisphaerales bacterium]
MLGSLKNMKPLIASGAAVKKTVSVLDAEAPKKIKTPFTKRQLDAYKAILLAKRAELLGDIQHLEDEALKSGTGDSAHTTNHITEQGSDNYDQTLNLNLAAVDRKRLAEIDEALQRIVDKTYGACMITGEPIKKARLDELPWAKYSIKAAQELDRRGY